MVPLTTVPIQVSNFFVIKDLRYKRVCSINASMFKGSLSYYPSIMGNSPSPKSVLVINNVSFHHSGQVEQMCSEARVKVVYLPPNSPDLNPPEKILCSAKSLISAALMFLPREHASGVRQVLKQCVEMTT